MLHIGSVRSAVYLWVNGEPVGYGEGSKVPAEFDITDFVRFGDGGGENEIVLKVLRFSSGAFLEDQGTATSTSFLAVLHASLSTTHTRARARARFE